MATVEPKGCLQEKPTAQSILFAGKYINLKEVARQQGIDESYLSRIFSGKRPLPRADYAMRIAKALGLGLEELIHAIEARKRSLALEDDTASLSA